MTSPTESSSGWFARAHSDDSQGASGATPRPILRRGSAASEESNHAQSPSSYRHTPPSARAIDPDEARERQRTMDVESAMLLSRARSGSIHNTHPSLGVAVQHSHPHPHPGHTYESPLDTDFPMLSQREEDEMTLARGEYDAAPVVTAYDDIESESAIPHRPASPERSGAATPVKEPHLQSSGFGLSRFDFTPMEEFAAEERRKFGISSPTAPTGGLEDLRRRMQAQKTRQAAFVEPPTDLEAQSEVGNATATEDGDKFQKLRQRTLSQSHPKPRARSRKLAQFEGDVGAPPPSLLYPSTPGPSVSFGDGTTSRPDMLRIDSTAQSRPYRFSFYSNSQASTIHSRSICELPAEGQSFEQLFQGITDKNHLAFPSEAGQSQSSTRVPSAADSHFAPRVQRYSAIPKEEDLPTWWLDVLAPTDEEMRMFSKVFPIHPLTTEDILMEETREKIELFRHYYLVCFRGFDQDINSPTYLEPVNMYIIVFREGVLSFHFHATPHPLNVRRRIKQLKDYISVTSDWISYALIDDITDAFGPLIQSIEYEVDSIDELVLILKEAEQSDMLRRIGTCRKKVMGLLRLMGNKADVVKGLAKRSNENWSVAPKSDIGLYLSDIQDHLITMTQNLNHYEKILSRSHSNYLAQISIEMTDANNKINDVLSKLTALGTVLIPMNLITGLWGMNVHVPGQDTEAGYTWFFSIVGGLIAVAAFGGFITYRLMSR